MSKLVSVFTGSLIVVMLFAIFGFDFSPAEALAGAGLQGVSARAQPLYPSTDELQSLLRQVDAALRDFEELTNNINFRRFDAPYGLVNAKESLLNATRRNIAASNPLLADALGSGRIAGASLVKIYLSLDSAGDEAYTFGDDVGRYTKDTRLAIDLTNLSTRIRELGTSFAPKMYQFLDAQDFEILTCRANRGR